MSLFQREGFGGGPTCFAKWHARGHGRAECCAHALTRPWRRRVGSIGDNRLGGWHSYRVSKAAHNQALRTASVELLPKRVIVLALHPGTVDTELSAPFMQSASKRYKIFSAEESATHLLDVVDRATLDDSGRFFAWDKTNIPF